MSAITFLRQFRIGGYAVFDFAVALLLMYLIAPLLSKLFAKIKLYIPKRSRLYLTLPIGILVHILVGNVTPMTRAFIDIHGQYILKIVILVLLVLGIKDIRIIKKTK